MPKKIDKEKLLKFLYKWRDECMRIAMAHKDLGYKKKGEIEVAHATASSVLIARLERGDFDAKI